MVHRWMKSCGISAVVLLATTPFGSAARLFLASHPTNLDPTDKYCDLLLRELPRQELISIAIDDLGARCGRCNARERRKGRRWRCEDRPDAQTEPGWAFPARRALAPTTPANRSTRPTSRTIFSFTGSEPRPKSCGENGQGGSATVAGSFGQPAFAFAAADQVGCWLHCRAKLGGNRKVSLHDRFSKCIHGGSDGASRHRAGWRIPRAGWKAAIPRRWVDYLAEANRDLDSAHSAAMFARAYVYAQRLMRQAPDDPASYWHRAYLETLHGTAVDAIADSANADELAHGGEMPQWAALARQMLAYDTMGLYREHSAEQKSAAFELSSPGERSSIPAWRD